MLPTVISVALALAVGASARAWGFPHQIRAADLSTFSAAEGTVAVPTYLPAAADISDAGTAVTNGKAKRKGKSKAKSKAKSKSKANGKGRKLIAADSSAASGAADSSAASGASDSSASSGASDSSASSGWFFTTLIILRAAKKIIASDSSASSGAADSSAPSKASDSSAASGAADSSAPRKAADTSAKKRDAGAESLDEEDFYDGNDSGSSARRDINDILTLFAASSVEAQRRNTVRLLAAIARRAADELN
ncbi:hypothetical protein FA95DRAFT_1676361 [Auriscalpium vulgare]|uniref:Uncharacterized protein n=1 Tax=Auriscalpium vulgare TaxID=40419 RepID=A0ACB8S411_9AGAM|nr:hypothetical protein FA95DRAFT_1676361 [Auriscalpium vulgare]